MRTWLSFLLLAGCAGLTACSSGDSQEAPAENSAETMAAIPISTTVLEPGTVPALIYAWGTVEPLRSADILSGVAGTVTSRKARLGDRVQQGSLLLEIDPSVYLAQAKEAEANLAKAEQGVTKAAKDLERHESLFSRKEISETQVESARLDAKSAEAELARAEALHARAKLNYRDARPTAPFAGTVANRPPDPGTSVNLAQLLVRLVDISKVLVVAEVSEQSLHDITAGMEARIQVEGESREFMGRVIGIGPEASLESRQFPVEIEVENPPGHPLKAGMIARVFIQTALHENVPLIPVDALLERDGETGFFTVDNNSARWRPVKTGPRRGDLVAILEGAESGQTVVVMGQNRLIDGAPVEVEQP